MGGRLVVGNGCYRILGASLSLLVALAVLPLDVFRAEALAAPRRCAGRTPDIVGTWRPDTLTGTPGADVIVGLGGYDVIDGRGGNDVICGNSGNDVLIGARGSDLLFGGRGRDALAGARGADRLRGGGGSDALVGGLHADRLLGGPDVDLLTGGAGHDVLRGGSGADLAAFTGIRRRVWVNLRRGVARGHGRDVLRNIENVTGGPKGDRIVGDAGANVLIAARGHDRVRALAGKDVVMGGRGHDYLDGGRGQDMVSYVTSRSAVRVDLAWGRSRGEGIDTLVRFEDAQGSRGDDFLYGDATSNKLLGFDGRDVIDGRGGLDIASYVDVFDASADLAAGTGGNHKGMDRLMSIEGLEASLGGSKLAGDDAPNLLLGRQGEDELHGRGGDDRLLGRRGDDEFFPGPGADIVIGGGELERDVLDYADLASAVDVDLEESTAVAEGIDSVFGIEEVVGTAHPDVIRGGPASERLLGWDGDDHIDGGAGFDDLRGGRGNDLLEGGEWDDELEGGEGDDRLYGGPGLDRLLGGDASTAAEPADLDQLFGGEGDDQLLGEKGDDFLDGGPGRDSARHIGLDTGAGVEADLEAGYVRAEGNDSVAGIEIVTGSSLDDVLLGNGEANFLSGGPGHDVIDGREGDDILQATRGDDVITGGYGDDHIVAGEGTDEADAGAGIDDCWYVEIRSGCEYDETSTLKTGFDFPYDEWEWNGYILPRSLSAYRTPSGITGNLVALDGSIGCERHMDIYLERWESDRWVWPQRAGGRRYDFSIVKPGTYRVRALARNPDTDGPMCEGAVSESFYFPGT